MAVTPEVLQMMIERDQQYGPLQLGEDTSIRYAGLPGVDTGIVTEHGIVPADVLVEGPAPSPITDVVPSVQDLYTDPNNTGGIPLLTSIFGFDIPDWLAGAVGAATTGGAIGLLWDHLFGGGSDTPTATSTAVTTTGDNAMSDITNYYGIGGPGVPEPAAGVLKQWKTKAFANDVGEYWVYYFKMMDGYTLCYNGRKKEWKRWKPKKNIVISRDPRLSTVRKAERAVFGTLKRLAKKSDYLALQKRR